MKRKSIDFDVYADRYEQLLKEQLSFFSSSRDYFSAYKIELIAKLLPDSPRKILDFGCGVGLSLPHFQQYFPDAELYATDISNRSLDLVRSKYTDVYVIEDEELDNRNFDLVFLSGVLHHVEADQRMVLMDRLRGLVGLEGILCIFEHNPINPVTRKMVATCPFDEGVQLISMGDMLKMIRTGGKMICKKKGYCLFFPEILRALRSFENYLRWLPLGGQYFVIASVK